MSVSSQEQHGRLEMARADLEENPFSEWSAAEYIGMYEDDELLCPENLEGLVGTAKAAKRNRRKAIKTMGMGRVEKDDTHYASFNLKLESMGAETERKVGPEKIGYNYSDSPSMTRAIGDDITLEMHNPLGSPNTIQYEFDGEQPEELTDLDKAIVGYSWQFFDETWRYKAGRRASEFVNSITSAID